MSISSIVNVQISRQTSVPTRAGFGTGAFLANDTTLTNLTKEYTSFEDMEGDSELTGSDALGAGAAYFGQQLAAPKFTVIKEVSAVAQVSVLTVSDELITGNSTVVTLNGAPLAAEVYATSHAATMTAIAALIQAEAAVATAVAAGNAITITAAVADTPFSVSSVTTLGATQPTWISQVSTEAGGIAGSLTNAVSENNDWYGLAIHSRTDADITLASDWVQSQGTNNPKFFAAQSDDVGLLNQAVSTDIASVLTAKANFRTAVLYHALDSEYFDCGWMGGQLPNDPGSITWAYKSVSLVTVDIFASGEKSAAHAKNVNTYSTVASVNITEEGKVCDSPFEWIDVIRGVDWIQVNVTAELFALLAKLPKLPYDTLGIANAKATILGVLSKAQVMGILSKEVQPVVTVPALADVSDSNKANRVLNGVTFEGILEGAVQKINVLGTVTL